MIKKVGITGQEGFIGKHLFNNLKLFENEFKCIEFKREFFNDELLLDNFVEECDVIVHLAAMNRSNDPTLIYDNNLRLVNQLIASLNRTKSKAHIIFSSSSQEEKNNLYGQSKKEGRNRLEDWANNSGGILTGLIIPNVFGPFGVPFYNSVVATFCYQLTHNEIPQIQVDGELNLIYISELVSVIINKIRKAEFEPCFIVPHTSTVKVSKILEILNIYVAEYLLNGIIPKFDNLFELNLFNTFRSYIEFKLHYPVCLFKNVDNRGVFVEILKLNSGGQISFSTTLPGITRGNHFHTRKIERFAVIKGKALIQLRRIGTEDVLNFELSGDNPAYVDMPIWYTHNIKNIGDDELVTIFWINEFFNRDDTDTFFEIV